MAKNIVNLGGELTIEGDIYKVRVIDTGDDEFMLCNLSQSSNVFIHKDEIDDMIALLTAVKNNGYTID